MQSSSVGSPGMHISVFPGKTLGLESSQSPMQVSTPSPSSSTQPAEQRSRVSSHSSSAPQGASPATQPRASASGLAGLQLSLPVQ